jgi:hypothetical protein
MAAALGLLSMEAANLLPVDVVQLLPVEPIVFGILIILLVLVQGWCVRLARPLTPIHTSRWNHEPLLCVCVLHVLLLVAPAYVFGVKLEQRVKSAHSLVSAVVWRELAIDFMTSRLDESGLALTLFSENVAADRMPRLKNGQPDIAGLQKMYEIKGLVVLPYQRSDDPEQMYIGYQVALDDFEPFYGPLYGGLYGNLEVTRVAMPVAASHFFSIADGKEAQLMREGRSWCGHLTALMSPLRIHAPFPDVASQGKASDAVARAILDAESPAPPDAALVATRIRSLVESFVGGLGIQELVTGRSQALLGNFGTVSPLVEVVLSTSAADKSQVQINCTARVGPLLGPVTKELEQTDYKTANSAYDIAVLRELATISGDAALGFDPTVMKIRIVTDKKKLWSDAEMLKFRQDASRVIKAVRLLQNVYYVYTGREMPERAVYQFPWLEDWYWFGSRFATMFVAYFLVSACLAILCWRSATRSQFAASMLAPLVVAALLYAAGLAMSETVDMVALAIVAGGGLACLGWTATREAATPLRKGICLGSVTSLPVVAAFVVRVLWLGCSQDPGSFPDRVITCSSFGEGDLRFWYLLGAVGGLVGVAEVALLLWRTVAVKPSR